MEDKILILEGENHTFKSLSEMADKDNKKIVIVGAHSDIERHVETIHKFSRGSIGVILLCTAQLAVADRNKIEKPKQDPFEGSLTQEVINQFSKFDERMLMPIASLEIEEKKQLREVKHAQAKPVKQFIPNHKNHHFKRK